MSRYGKCPFCKREVHATLIESNLLRRDVYKCPVCLKRILVCMAPGCNNFAKGGDYWDDNLCPDCGFSDEESQVSTHRNKVTVTTLDELKDAVNNKVPSIIVRGKLAGTIETAYGIAKYGPAAIVGLTALAATVPLTGGASLGVAAVAAAAGISDTVIIVAIVTIGLVLSLTLFLRYNLRVTWKTKNGDVAEIELKRKD